MIHKKLKVAHDRLITPVTYQNMGVVLWDIIQVISWAGSLAAVLQGQCLFLFVVGHGNAGQAGKKAVYLRRHSSVGT